MYKRKKLNLTAVKILILMPMLLDLMDELSSFYFIYLYIFCQCYLFTHGTKFFKGTT